MVLTGCKSLPDCILVSKIVANLLREGFPGNVFTLDVIKIKNIVGNTHVPLHSDEVLDLHLFYSDFNIFCTYQPNMFPGLVYRPTSLPIMLLIFFSGKVVITHWGQKHARRVHWLDAYVVTTAHVHDEKKRFARQYKTQNNFPEAHIHKQRPSMSLSNNKDNITVKNVIKQMPAALRQHLRDANIKDMDENSVAKNYKSAYQQI
jgi:hypothetical protein